MYENKITICSYIIVLFLIPLSVQFIHRQNKRLIMKYQKRKYA